MDYNYKVVLFRNKEKKRVIKKFITEKRALSFFDSLIKKNDDVIFEMKHENGLTCNYELGIIESNNTPSYPMFIRDEFGRQIKIQLENNDFKISRISKYRIEEKFLDHSINKKIDATFFIDNYLSQTGLKMLSKLNNKVVYQNDDKLNLFVFKNIDDSERFIDVISEIFMNEKRLDCIFVKDSSTIQRKYLYDILIKKGFQKKYLFRLSTTHPK